MFSIDAIMTTDLITLPPSASLADALSRMQEHRIHHLPIVEGEDRLVGLVTLTDVLAASDSRLRDDRSRIRPEDVSVTDFMVTDVATVDVRASLRQAALFLEKHQIGCLPVQDSGRLVGIITDTDFVAVAINLLEQLEDGEPEDDFDEADVA